MAPGQTSPSPRLLMLPEVWNSPYQAERFAEFAEPIPEPGSDLLDGPSASLKVVAEVAVSHGVSVIAGSIPNAAAMGAFQHSHGDRTARPLAGQAPQDASV